ncbi:DEAD/DEAH box helicase [Vibrio breoganii]
MFDYRARISEVGLSPREPQEQLFTSIAETLEHSTGSVLIAQADTGIGKTIAAALGAISRLESEKEKDVVVVVATPTLALCRDYVECFKKFDVDAHLLVSYRNYFCKDRLDALCVSDQFSAAEISEIASLKDWQGTIDEYVAEYFELPAGLAQIQVAQSRLTASDEYVLSREIALKSSVIVTTHAMVAADISQNGRVLNLSERESSLIVDEADAFIDSLKAFQTQHFNIQRELAFAKDLCNKRFNETVSEIVNDVRNVADSTANFSPEAKAMAIEAIECLALMLPKSALRGLTVEDKARIDENVDYLQWLGRDLMQSESVTLGVTEVLREPHISIYSPYFSRMFGHYIDLNELSVILMSGTLSISHDVKAGTEWVIRDLKLQGYPVSYIEVSPSQFGYLNLAHIKTAETIYESADYSAIEFNDLWCRDVANYASSLSGKVLIVTASFQEAESIGLMMGRTAYVQRKGAKLSSVKRQFIDSSCIRVLISPSAHTGINFIGDDGRSILDHIIVTRLGFSPANPILKSISKSEDFPQSKIDRLKKSEYYANLNAVIRRNRQIIGRGIRHKEDKIDVHIFDRRFPKYSEISGRFISLKQIVPKRFAVDYKNADVVSMSVTEDDSAERMDLSLLCGG